MNTELDVTLKLRTLLTIFLLGFLQIACSYTPVYESTGTPQVNAPDTGEQSNRNKQETNVLTGPQTATSEEPVRVAVVSPGDVKQRPTVSNKDIAAARLRTQAADAITQGQAAKAEQLLNRALRISPRSPETYHQLATIKLEKGNSGQALQLARKGLSLCDPDSKLAAQLHALASQAGSEQ